MSRCHPSPFIKGLHRTERDLQRIPAWLIHHAQEGAAVMIIGIRGDESCGELLVFGSGDSTTFGNASMDLTLDQQGTEQQEK